MSEQRIVFSKTDECDDVIDLQSCIAPYDSDKKITVVFQSGVQVQVLYNSFVVAKHVEIILQEHANVTCFFDQSGIVQNDTACIDIMCHRNATFNVGFRFFADMSAEVTINIYLREDGAQALLGGYYGLQNNNRLVLQTNQYHHAPHTQSDVVLHGAVTDSARVDFMGMIDIAQSAVKSESNLQNKNILLSDAAYAVSQPQLQVQTNDVQCAHGSAVGKWDSEILFYIQSRSLDDVTLKKLLLQSFFSTAFLNVENNFLKQIIKHIVCDSQNILK